MEEEKDMTLSPESEEAEAFFAQGEEQAEPEQAEATESEEQTEPEQGMRTAEGKLKSLDGVPPKWYVLHTYSGYENMVRDNLRMVFEKNNMLDRLYEITIPMEDVVEEKNGKRKIVQRKMFPCYVIVKMVYNNDMWHMITNTRGVTGFVGPMGRPLPLTEDEIKRMHLEQVVVETDYKVGDRVKVMDGPLAGFVGDIESIDAPNSKCRVIVSMFGRETPVNLELQQIERAE